jgi:hypothetical protein
MKYGMNVMPLLSDSCYQQFYFQHSMYFRDVSKISSLDCRALNFCAVIGLQNVTSFEAHIE